MIRIAFLGVSAMVLLTSDLLAIPRISDDVLLRARDAGIKLIEGHRDQACNMAQMTSLSPETKALAQKNCSDREAWLNQLKNGTRAQQIAMLRLFEPAPEIQAAIK